MYWFAVTGKEEYDYYGSSINPLHATTPSNLLTYEISGKQSMNVQNRSSGVRRCSKENLQYWAKHIAS